MGPTVTDAKAMQRRELEISAVEEEQRRAKERLQRANFTVDIGCFAFVALVTLYTRILHVHLAVLAVLMNSLNVCLYLLQSGGLLSERLAAILDPFCVLVPLLPIALATGGFRSPTIFIFWLACASKTSIHGKRETILPSLGAILLCYLVILSHDLKYFTVYQIHTFEGDDYAYTMFTLVATVTLNSVHKAGNLSEFTLRALQKEVDSNMSKSRFVAMVSHEMRTPLTTILGWLEIFSTKNLPVDIKAQLKVVKNSSNLLLSLINDILDFSKIDQGKLALDKHVFNLRQEIMHCVESNKVLFKSEVNLSIDVSLPGINFVYGDSLRMTQIINNFLSNAAKFTVKGEIEFSVKVDEKDAKTKDFTLNFQVADTGIGMSEETMNKIFQPFVQADSSLARAYGGTGLGLVISQQLITMMDGQVEVSSTLGVGTTFSWSIKLKMAEEPPSRLSQHFDTDVSSQTQRRKVLLVEDNKMNQTIISRLLEMHCYDVQTADNGQEAVTISQTAVFDVILMDFQMPVLDGIAATRKIRELGLTTPIIGLSANADEFAKQEATQAGMCNLLMKPIKGSDLKAMIEKSLDDLAAEVNRL